MHTDAGFSTGVDEPPMMTEAEVAEAWRVKVGTIRTWVYRGDPRLPAPIRYGRGFTRFRRREVLARMEAIATGRVAPLRRG
jgi:predicted site-specific integrase-resolvase